MGLISNIPKPEHFPSKEEICGIRIPLENYPFFTNIDPSEVLAYYMEIFVKDNVDPLVDPFNLPDDYPDVHGQLSKRSKKRKDVEEGTSVRRRRLHSLWTKTKCL